MRYVFGARIEQCFVAGLPLSTAYPMLRIAQPLKKKFYNRNDRYTRIPNRQN
jgi:hypothetical protein